MMKRIPLVVWILVVSAPLFFGANSPQAPLLITDASKAFISSVTQTNYGDRLSRTGSPNPGKLTGELFYDMPVAVHVPFDVPYQGRPVRIHYGLAVCFDYDKNLYRQIMFGTHGLYRQDGKTLPQDSVIYEDSRQPDSKKWQPIWFDASAPIPCWINATVPPKPEYRLIQARDATPETLKNEPSQRDMERPLVLKKAEPGPYVFWFTIMNWGDFDGWPTGLGGDTLKITLRVSLLVTAAEDQSSVQEPRHAYLFHGGPRPDRMADDQLYRAYIIDIPLTLSRNGWVFDHAEVVPLNQEVNQKRLTQEKVTTDIDAQNKITGRSVSMSLRTTTSDGTRVICQDAFAWDLTLPASIADMDVGDVLIAGSE